MESNKDFTIIIWFNFCIFSLKNNCSNIYYKNIKNNILKKVTKSYMSRYMLKYLIIICELI